MWCVVMLQGVALTKTIPVASHKPACTYLPEHNTALSPRLLRMLTPTLALSVFAVHLGVLTRKSTINAGTRYYARGLNKAGGPGNESECELLMWTTTTHSDLVRQKESRLCSPSATAPLPSTR